MKKRKTGIWLMLLLMLAVLCIPVQASAAKKGFKASKSGVIRYYGSNGKLVKNKWFKVGKKRYYAKANGRVATGVTNIKGKYYYFDKKGVNKTGWVTVKNKRYYFISGKRYAVTGLFTFKNKRTYYFNDKGVMQTGWITLDGNDYYFNNYMLTGWVTVNYKTYYLIKTNPLKGQKATGVFSIGGNLYYFDPDNGELQRNTTVEYRDRTYVVNSSGVCTVMPESGAPTGEMLFFLKFESGSAAYNQTGGDGGKACGAYQFDYRYALLPFVKYAYETNPLVCKEFEPFAKYKSGAKLYNNADFYKAWHQVYKRNSRTFSEMQDTFARINYYDNVERKIQAAGIDIASRSEAVKGAVFSYSIQHGQTSAVNAVKAIKPKSTTSDAQFLKKLYNYRKKSFPLYAARYTQEYKAALAELNQ